MDMAIRKCCKPEVHECIRVHLHCPLDHDSLHRAFVQSASRMFELVTFFEVVEGKSLQLKARQAVCAMEHFSSQRVSTARPVLTLVLTNFATAHDYRVLRQNRQCRARSLQS